MKAADLMSSPVHTCRADESCEVPAGHMWNRDCGCVVVTNDDGTVAGIVTDRDLCMAGWTTGRALRGIPVRDVMSSPVRAVRDTDSIQDVAKSMAQEQVNRVPVIDGKGVVVGLISTADLLREHHRHGATTADALVNTLYSISRSRNEPPLGLPAPTAGAASPAASPKAESTVTIQQPKTAEPRAAEPKPAENKPTAAAAPVPPKAAPNPNPKGKPSNPPRKN